MKSGYHLKSILPQISQKSQKSKLQSATSAKSAGQPILPQSEIDF